jgi:hypothetical protein
MSLFLEQFKAKLNLGRPHTYRNLTLVPILLNSQEEDGYLTLPEALQTGNFVVTEVDAAGSVPEVKVVNRLNNAVLLLDGEELVGAKQNRVVNTTILIAAQTELVIPVSCTEQGRWHETTDQFADSGVMMPPSVRGRKTASVGQSLRQGQRYNSDQADVWAAIEELGTAADVQGATGAMRDVYTGHQKSLDDYIHAYTPCEEQVGLVATVNGAVVGLDCVSSPNAYRSLADKIVRSYAMEALLDLEIGLNIPELQEIQAFLEEIGLCEEATYPGVGLGEEYRYQSRGIVGMALMRDEKVVHASFQRHTPPPPFTRSYWVRPGRLLAGYYPGAPSKEEAEDKLQSLIGAGIRCVINLVEEDERNWEKKPLRSYQRLLTKLGTEHDFDLTYLRIPIRDQDVPSEATMRAILDTIDGALARGQAVYVHCWGGRGRTGTVTGCYLARHGMALGEQALDQIAFLRRNEGTADQPSPETENQCDMVRGWKQGQ